MDMVGLDKTAAAIAGVGGVSGDQLKSHLFKEPLQNPTGATPFSGVVHSILDQQQALGKAASEAVTGLLNGSGTEIHDVMIASQKASVAFELALQVRNKAVSAYQQMMGMQF
jgi:flagellar hook-basal body complex protein FliE